MNARNLKHDMRFRGRVIGCQWYRTVCLLHSFIQGDDHQVDKRR